MARAIYRWLGLREGELGKTAGMFLYLLTAVGAFITGRIARDTLFLNRYDISYLPYMYVWVAAVMAVLSYTYSKFADRFRRDKLVLAITAVLLLLVLASRLILYMAGDWFYPVLYVFIEVMGGLLIIQFWTFANDVFNTREAKRLFGLVGSGGVVATILSGFAVGALAQVLGTENLLYLCAGLLACTLLVVSTLSRTFQRELSYQATSSHHARQAISLGTDWGKVFNSRHLKVIAWIILFTFIAITIVDYQFKIIARYTYLNREDTLSRFFGLFYAFTGVLSFLIQFLLTGRLMQHAGIILSLLLLPLCLAAGSLLLLALPALWTVAVLKGADNVLRYSINEATTQLLYLPVPGRIRGRAKAFIEGILRPLAQGATGLVLAWTAAWVGYRVAWLSAGSLVVLAIWTILVLGLKKEYVRSLLGTLRQRRLHFGEASLAISDSQAIDALNQTLLDKDEGTVLHALEMVPYVQQHDWSGALGRLLEHDSPRIRLQAIRLLEKEDKLSHMQNILARFQDPNEEVRAEAVISYCTSLKERAMPVVEPLLRDESVRVKAAAVVGLIRYGGLDGIVAAAEVLRSMVESGESSHRRVGAWAIGQVGIETFFRSILPLLDDPEPSVRIEAVHAAGKLKCPELTLPLIYRLADHHATKATISALGAYGQPLITTLRTVLDNPQEDPAIRQAIPKVLSRIGGQMSMDVLSNILETDQTALRSSALDAILHLHIKDAQLRRDREMLRRSLHRDLKEAFQLHVILDELAPLGQELIMENLRNRVDLTIERIFKLLRVLNPGRHLDAVYRNLESPNPAVRANSLELLDNILDAETRRCLMALLEEQQPAQVASRGDELFPLLHLDARHWLHELLVSDHSWTVVCSLHAIGRLGDPSFAPAVGLMLSHPSALVREACVFCLKQLAAPEQFEEAVHFLNDDPSPRVRQAAAFLLA